jgi:hypothetical protein
VFHAVRCATWQGRPINTAITINFTALGLSEAEASDAFIWVRTGFRRRWKREHEAKGRQIGTLDDVHAHENPEGAGRHVHWGLHRPSAMSREELAREIIRRVKKLARGPFDPAAVLIQHDDEVCAPGTWAKYILKGTDPAYGAHLFMRTEPQGWVTGRRTGTSRTLGKTARKAAGWSRKSPPPLPANDAEVSEQAAA